MGTTVIFILTQFEGDEWDWKYVPKFFVYTEQEAMDWVDSDPSNNDYQEIGEYGNPNV